MHNALIMDKKNNVFMSLRPRYFFLYESCTEYVFYVYEIIIYTEILDTNNLFQKSVQKAASETNKSIIRHNIKCYNLIIHCESLSHSSNYYKNNKVQ